MGNGMRPQLVENQASVIGWTRSDVPKNSSYGSRKAFKDIRIENGPLFPRNLFTLDVKWHVDHGRSADCRHANSHVAGKVAVDDQVKRRPADGSCNRRKQKTLHPDARMKKFRLMSRQNERRIEEALVIVGNDACSCRRTESRHLAIVGWKPRHSVELRPEGSVVLNDRGGVFKGWIDQRSAVLLRSAEQAMNKVGHWRAAVRGLSTSYSVLGT